MKTLRQILENKDDDYVYHGTNEDGLYGIQSHGHLKVHKPSHGTDQQTWPDGQTEKRSYWHHDPKVIDSFYPEEGKPILIRAKRSSHSFKRERTGDTYTTKPIHKDNLEYHDNGEWKKV